MTIPAIALPTLTLSKTEDAAVTKLRGKLAAVAAKNLKKSQAYEAKTPPEDLGIAAPKDLPDLINAVMG